MSNVFPNVKMNEVYDMKGSWISRGGSLDFEPNAGLGKDLDLKDMITIGPENKQKLLSTLRSDVTV